MYQCRALSCHAVTVVATSHMVVVLIILHVLACWTALHVLIRLIALHALTMPIGLYVSGLYVADGPPEAAGGPQGPLLESCSTLAISWSRCDQWAI